MLTTAEIAPSLRPGMHAATFGGNPIAASAGIATIQMIENENLLEHGQSMSQRFSQQLTDLAEQCDIIEEIRIRGMMIGIQLSVEGTPFVQSCMDRGLLINCTQTTVLRLLPALNITADQVDAGIEILSDVLQSNVE